MITLIVRRGDVNTASALARSLEDHPDVRVIMERRRRPLAAPAVADRRRVPEMREQDRRAETLGGGNRRATAPLFSFGGVLT